MRDKFEIQEVSYKKSPYKFYYVWLCGKMVGGVYFSKKDAQAFIEECLK